MDVTNGCSPCTNNTSSSPPKLENEALALAGLEHLESAHAGLADPLDSKGAQVELRREELDGGAPVLQIGIQAPDFLHVMLDQPGQLFMLGRQP